MIKKSIIFAIFLLICWSIFIYYKPFSLSQHQWQGNIINAEIFLFDIESPVNLIVGSSLSGALQKDSLPDFYNLSFGGQGIFDGLNLLRSKKKLPKNVFIETNVIGLEENTNFKEIISSPILNTIKEKLSIFRTDKQPLAYATKQFFQPIIDVFFSKIIYRIRDKIKLELKINEKSNVDKSEILIFNKMLALQVESYSATVEILKFDKQFTELKKHIYFLESQGVKVIFFEMPVNPILTELNKAKYLRNRVRKDFPNNAYIGLPQNIDSYTTSDGVHLTNEESKIYTNYFKKEAAIIVK